MPSSDLMRSLNSYRRKHVLTWREMLLEILTLSTYILETFELDASGSTLKTVSGIVVQPVEFKGMYRRQNGGKFVLDHIECSNCHYSFGLHVSEITQCPHCGGLIQIK